MRNLIFSYLLLLIFYQSVSAKQLTKDDCKCRLSVYDQRNEFKNFIVGGAELTLSYRIPWQVSLATQKPMESFHRPFCGGVVINDKIVMTSASCLTQFNTTEKLSQLRLRIGMHDFNDWTTEYDTFTAEKIIIDERFDQYNKSMMQVGDIGFIKVNGTIKFSKFIQPSCLGLDDEHYEGKNSLTAVGWGSKYKVRENELNSNDVILSPTLKAASFDYVQPKDGGNDDHLIKGTNLFKSICVGDLGGSLMYIKNGIMNEKGKIKTVGLAQYFSSRYVPYIWKQEYCVGPESGFARLSFYKDVIESVPEIGKNYCS